MSIQSFIAKTGESPNFIAFMAHSGVAAYVVSRFPYGLPRVIVASIFTILAATKEFWFDLHYEKTPPQTLADSALDFAGYVTGIVVGALVP